MLPSVDKLIKFESGELGDSDVVCLFSDLVKSGLAWQLQGYYGRVAQDMISAGYIDEKGNILEKIDA